MRISVIIPCHNAASWIGETLKSAAAQEFAAHEIIVVNDASTDDSEAAIERSGVPVTVLRTDFRNAAAARNAGIERAEGDWIALLDADDIWFPHHLRYAAELLSDSGDVAFIAHHQYLEEIGAIHEMPRTVIPNIAEPQTGQSHLKFVEIAASGFQFGHSTVLYRRDRLQEVGGFDPLQKRRHDMDLWLRMIAGRTWTYDSRSHGLYRHRTPGGISTQVVNCEYFYLRALLKNAAAFRSPAMGELVETSARRSVSLAFVDGTSEDFTRALEQAAPHLPTAYRFFYRAACVCPPLFRSGIAAKRRIFWNRYHATGSLPAEVPEQC